MKILVVSYLPEKKFSARQHLAFLRLLEKYHDHEYIYIHGSNVLEKGLTALDLFHKYSPSIVIHYDSHAPSGKETRFSPGYFRNLPCLKVMIETDFGKKAGWNSHPLKPRWGTTKWYNTNQFDLVIRRGSYLGQKDIDGIPSVWLPFSANDEFYSDPEIKREQKICFAGAYRYEFYTQRRIALKVLSNASLLVQKAYRTPTNNYLYPIFLRSFIASLTSAEVRSAYGKVFEVMASGTVLLTPDFDHKKDLFGDDECFVEYKDDASDLAAKAQKIINEPAWAKSVAQNALKVIASKHTHKHRIAELNEHLCNTYLGRPIKHRWEIE